MVDAGEQYHEYQRLMQVVGRPLHELMSVDRWSVMNDLTRNICLKILRAELEEKERTNMKAIFKMMPQATDRPDSEVTPW